MIRKAVLHPANMSMVIIENPCVALPRAAVVHDNKLPTTALHRRAPDCFNYGAWQVTVGDSTTPWPQTESARRRRWRRLQSLVLVDAGRFNDELRLPRRWNRACALTVAPG